ncbi:hypothetical protein N7540_010974, partial [Penicillium herquei]
NLTSLVIGSSGSIPILHFFAQAMVKYQAVSRLLFLGTTQTLIPTVLVIATPKGSLPRYLSIPLMIWNLSLMLCPVERPSYLAATCAGAGFIGIVSALDMLFINPKHAGDFDNGNGRINTFFSRLQRALDFMANPRKIKTSREAKNTPSPPAYYTKRGSKAVTRGRFLIRETAIAVWQYMALDILTVQATKSALKNEKMSVFGALENSRVELWSEKLVVAVCAWFIVSRILISFYYRAVSVFCVALKLESPEKFPPLFNRMADAYTLRNFWGKFWHQTLRINFTAVSSFITRDLLGLPTPSLLERYTNVFFVFFLSGILHSVTDVVLNIPVGESGAMVFFLSFTIGYMIEDSIQAAWKTLQSSGGTSKEPELWKKTIGYFWVVTFLTVTSAVYFKPVQNRPERQVSMVPWSVANVIGSDLLSGIVLVGGVLLKCVFKVEV